MTMRARKFVGMLALIALLTAYVLAAMIIGAELVNPAGRLAQLAFYVVAGLGWILPAMPIIRWMQRPDAA